MADILTNVCQEGDSLRRKTARTGVAHLYSVIRATNYSDINTWRICTDAKPFLLRTVHFKPQLPAHSTIIMMHVPAQIFTLISALPAALACLGYEGGVPTPTSTKSISSPITVAAGATFDCGWARYDRGSGACQDGEGGDSDAVFLVKAGGTLQNCIIGANQMEGVHCLGACTLKFICKSKVSQNQGRQPEGTYNELERLTKRRVRGCLRRCYYHRKSPVTFRLTYVATRLF